MKFRAIVLILLVALVVGVGAAVVVSSARTRVRQQEISELEEKDKKEGPTLRERAKLAKLRGQPSLFVQLSQGTAMYAGFKDFETAAAVYTVVVARPVALTGHISEEDIIGTSYKFKTLEVISEPPPSRFPVTFSGEFPAELRRWAWDVFLLPRP